MGYSPRGHKESDTTGHARTHALKLNTFCDLGMSHYILIAC